MTLPITQPSSPLPWPCSPRPLLRSPSSTDTATVTPSAKRRQRNTKQGSSEPKEGGAFLVYRDNPATVFDNVGSPPPHKHRQLPFYAQSEVTLPKGLANWRRLPRIPASNSLNGQKQARDEVSKQPIRNGEESPQSQAAGTKASNKKRADSKTSKARSKGLGMGMLGTPAKKGWSKSKDKSKSIGVHSTPNEITRIRSRSHSHSQSSVHPAVSAVDTLAYSSSEDLSDLPPAETASELSSDDLPISPPSISIPSIPKRQLDPVHRPDSYLRKIGKSVDYGLDDVFSASYIRKNSRLARPVGLPVDDDLDFEDLVTMAEQDAATGDDDGAYAVEGPYEEKHVDMLWPIVSSSDSRDVSSSAQKGSASTRSSTQSRLNGTLDTTIRPVYTEYTVPVKGTPYKVRGGSVPGTGMGSGTGTGSGSVTSKTPKAGGILKSALKRPDTLAVAPGARAAQLVTAANSGVHTRFSPAKQTSSSLTSSSLPSSADLDRSIARIVAEQGKSLQASAASQILQTTVEETDSRVEMVWSMDEPLKGLTPSERAGPAEETARARKISSRPKTPAKIRFSPLKRIIRSARDAVEGEDEDETDISTPSVPRRPVKIDGNQADDPLDAAIAGIDSKDMVDEDGDVSNGVSRDGNVDVEPFSPDSAIEAPRSAKRVDVRVDYHAGMLSLVDALGDHDLRTRTQTVHTPDKVPRPNHGTDRSGCHSPADFEEEMLLPVRHTEDRPDNAMLDTRNVRPVEWARGEFGRWKMQMDQSFHSPMPWTPSSHRGSPSSTRHRSSSPITFSPSPSPSGDRMITPSPDDTLNRQLARMIGNPKSPAKRGRAARRGLGEGSWKGAEVMRRMEEADRHEAEFAVWTGVEGGGQSHSKSRKRVKCNDLHSVEEGSDVDGTGDPQTGVRRIRTRAKSKRRRIKREDVLSALYKSEVEREGRDKRIEYYGFLEKDHKLTVELVW